MEGLLGQISSKLSISKKEPAAASQSAKQGPSFAIPAGRSLAQSFSKSDDASGAHSTPHTPPRASTPPDDYAADDGQGGDEPMEVCKREDSETYAKRTITEIETCLGFRFGGGGPAPPEDETIDDAEIQNLNSQVEAALAQGLSFKDKFRTSDRRRATASDVGDDDADAAGVHGSSGSGDGGKALEDVADGVGAPPVAAAAAVPVAAAPAGGAAAAAKAAAAPGAGPKKKLGGLKLAVGSQMDTGEWTSHGQFLKRDKPGTQIPGGLQQIKVEDLIKVKELGRGCFGSVWLAKWRGVEVALKEMLHQASCAAAGAEGKPGGHDTNPAEVFSEAEKLASLRHPCVMGFYGIVTSPDAYATVSEYICHGSLRGGLMKIKKKGIHDKRLRAYITLQAAHGMEYLHLNYMVHFDLKCDNLLCDLRDLNKPVVKIGDLGLSKLKKGSFVSGNMRGTLPWMAPELFPSVPAAVSGVHARPEAEDRVDVFSFGVCMWEIWTLGEQPYPNLSLQEIFAGVMTGTLRPALPPGCDPAWASLMQDCWHGNPRLRPSFTEIIHRLEAMLQRWGAPSGGSAGGGSGGGALAAAAAGGGGGGAGGGAAGGGGK
ncbi:hypothetical protein Rsub_06167 [Raphidocelis subcapitata]|uniref:Protein kinase domain-containing protein n=1 Tax=Raphidocelis subcapitata TaxID=307507 RepID=A0A2V0P212_9CHLO|nr:hypothetical protein Rsub_06167 [Raphidocelis subcapitata]|eukprot:GBF93918.1 hypothetical protein Rsub_06167 [Raphidocelis subcapitata]